MSNEPRFIPPLRHSRITVRGGAVLLVRRGPLNFVDQKRGFAGARAPERRGLWAFPYPFYDEFFAHHKWDEVLPKHLTRAALMAAYEAGVDTNTLYEERDKWIKKNQSVQPLRRFWWEGELYTRFARGGKSDEKVEWHLLSVSDWEEAARRVEPGHGNWYSVDHMEVFCAPTRGRIVSR